MSDEVLLRVENVSKRFCRSLKSSLWYGLQDLGKEIGGSNCMSEKSEAFRLREDEFWAVKDVSFELRKGECLGLIGGNGAGKTILLRMLNGLIKPDTGSIEIKGKVGALIGIQTGLHPLLTGRENIYLKGAILGMNKKTIKRKIDEIIDFAQIGDFIDSPLYTYSSGMSARLGFSIASTLESNLIILDEVLAVGDESFQLSCYNRISKLIENNNTSVILVTHQLQNIERICTRAVIMKGGIIEFESEDTSEVVARYLTNVADQRNESGNCQIFHPNNSQIRCTDAKYCSSEKCVELKIDNKLSDNYSNLEIIASYCIYVSSTELIRGTTRGAQNEKIKVTDSVKIEIPDPIAIIPDVLMNITLWDANKHLPYCSIKRIPLHARIYRKPYRIGFKS